MVIEDEFIIMIFNDKKTFVLQYIFWIERPYQTT